MKILIGLLCGYAALYAQSSASLSITGPSAPVSPGSSISFSVNLTNSAADGAGSSALQFSVNVAGGSAIAGPSVTSTAKQLTCAQVGGQLNCIADGAQNILPNGVVATVNFTPSASGSVAITSQSGASPIGDPRSLLAGAPFPYTVSGALNRCDLDSNGVVNTADSSIMRQRVLSAMSPGSSPNVTDLQKVNNAASGQVCTL